MYCTEKEFLDDVKYTVEWNGHESTSMYITKREKHDGSLQYDAICAIQTSIDNEELIRKLMVDSLDKEFDFIGSEMDVANGSVIDYIFVRATITQKLF